MSAIGLGIGLGLGGALFNNTIGTGISGRTARYNQYLNELSAKNADIRTRNLYNDLYSPEAKIKQLKEAGLSPSLFSDMATAGGTTQGAQGAGAAGIQTTFTPIDFANTTLALAQARQANSEADKNEGTNASGKAQIELWLAETNNIKAQQQLTEMQSKATELQNYITQQTTDFQIETAEHIAEQKMWESQLFMYQAFHEKINKDFDLHTFQDRVKQVELVNENLITDYLRKQSEIELNETRINEITAEINKWSEEIKQEWCKVLIESAKAENQRKAIGIQDKFVNQQVEYLKNRINVDNTLMVNTIVQGTLSNLTDIADLVTDCIPITAASKALSKSGKTNKGRTEVKGFSE